MILATFGRSFYVLDDYSALRFLKDQINSKAYIFPIKKSLMYIDSRPLGLRGKGSQGESYFTAENPPIGAVINYIFNDTLKTKKEIRQSNEKKKIKSQLDIQYPSINELKEEDNEEKPYLIFTIFDDNNTEIRKIIETPKIGFNSVVWNFRLTPQNNISLKSSSPGRYSEAKNGPLALPGKYYVTMHKVENGKSTMMVDKTPFECEWLNQLSTPTDDKIARLSFQLKVDKIINETNDQIKIIEDENMKKKKTIQEDANENINNMIQKNTDSSKRKLETIYRTEQELKTTLDTINAEIKSQKEEKQQLQLQKSDVKDELSKYIDFEPFTGMSVEEITNNKKEKEKKITVELMDKINNLDNRISTLEISLSTLETRRTATMKQLSELQGSMNEQIVSIQQETQNKNSEIRQQLNSAKEINMENIEKSSESKINSLRFRMQDASKNHGILVKENTKHINESNEKIIRINKILDNIKIIKNRNDDFLNNVERNKRDDKPASTLAEKRDIKSTKIDGIINSSAPQCFEVDGIQYCPT